MYLFGMSVGISAILSGHFKIGLKRIVHPVAYWRYPVFNLVKDFLKKQNNLRVLDIGSPKLLSLYLALRKGFEVFATDLQDSEIFSIWQAYYNDCKKNLLFPINKFRNGNLYNTEFQDARSLSYPDGYFDLVYSISVLEHIPGDGDAVASKEISRVLRPGGMAIIEVPFSNKEYDTYLNRDIYERKFIDRPVFYQRHYDKKTIQSRLINPSKLIPYGAYVISERIPLESIMGILPVFLQVPLLFLSPLLSKWNHTNSTGDLIESEGNRSRIGARDIVLYLKKDNPFGPR